MDKTKEADEVSEMLIPMIRNVSHDVALRLNAAVAEDREARIRALQTSSSPSRKLRTNTTNGTNLDSTEVV